MIDVLRKLLNRPSRSRVESNRWLIRHCAEVYGDVLSIGSGSDDDGQGKHYRDYFAMANSYRTSEITEGFDTDMVIDVRSMPEIRDALFDCVFCSGVLEHVDRYQDALSEISRVLKPGGILLLGLPFRQSLHMAPYDFWRFTEYGIRKMLARDFEIIEVSPIDASVRDFPAAYRTRARKIDNSSNALNAQRIL